jgi:hypothetical protein
MAKLQRPGQSEDKRDVFHLIRFLADDFDVRLGAGGEAAGERRVGVDVEFEEVEEGVGYEFDGAVLFRLDAVVEFERFACFVAVGEGRPFYLVRGVFYVFACFAETVLVMGL